MKTPKRIIIDTDPGQDDAAAILLALGSPEDVQLLAITTVAGNVPLQLTSRNALTICELAGRSDIPVYAGAGRPLRRKLVTAEHVHGKTGLDGPTLPAPVKTIEAANAVDFLIETFRNEPRCSITLCALGPLTNIALALDKAPDIAPNIRELVLMGGGFFEGGNITPTAEFNMYVDPEAADIVLRSGIPITMMPLDVTHQVLTLKRRVDRLRAIGSKPALALAEMFQFAERFDIEKYGTDGGPLHDPTVVAFLIRPELFTGRLCNVEVELYSDLTVGMTVVDWWKVTNRKPNVTFMRSVDHEGFFDLLIERIGRL